ncbi:carboxynorspermidine decarboxylase [Dethiosulfatibacter aminovorans DSM 17477]|uniref:Carboxynorspermidine decarboxylase n=1 Tax=Dethiosulfatibacter aminovorans DSM 17477 TaxID=1121476 RepID=A0A1M6IIK8_9FIRM|nr:carboxynorspermidine decarboxylase [Dethiosulfatibacter aminovorans]SHJ34237.1 carboxynorspermidine decarboxylase [Dethiosulfatibacter aminovorans DSM 17477]
MEKAITSRDIEMLKGIKTPAYVVDERLLKKNLELLKSVQDRTGAKILLALKGFSMYHEFPLVGEYLAGITSSSLNEAMLGRKHMNKEVHIYAPAYRPDEIDEIGIICDHIVFNSSHQIKMFKDRVKTANPSIEIGLRVNPEYSEVATEIYNPCASNSRLGAKLDTIEEEDFEVLDGIHFHTMCEQNSDTLERTLVEVEKRFGHVMHKMKWINFGGGHHVTREDYDVDLLIGLIERIRDTYDVQVYLEPGEAIALNTGYLVTEVLDLVKNNMDLCIVDTSAACHMPDVIEMPYRPHIIGSGKPGEFEHTYRLGGLTCLAGDIIGDYSFKEPLKVGDKLIFTDMAHYTMVKNNTFNGVNLPSIAVMDDEGIEVVKTFGFEDYESRL